MLGHVPELLTLGEAASLLVVSRTTVWRLVQAGHLVEVHVGPEGTRGGARITVQSCRAYLARRTAEATPPGGIALGATWPPGSIGALEHGEGAPRASATLAALEGPG